MDWPVIEELLPEGWPDLERKVALSQWKSQKWMGRTCRKSKEKQSFYWQVVVWTSRRLKGRKCKMRKTLCTHETNNIKPFAPSIGLRIQAQRLAEAGEKARVPEEDNPCSRENSRRQSPFITHRGHPTSTLWSKVCRLTRRGSSDFLTSYQEQHSSQRASPWGPGLLEGQAWVKEVRAAPVKGLLSMFMRFKTGQWFLN